MSGGTVEDSIRATLPPVLQPYASVVAFIEDWSDATTGYFEAEGMINLLFSPSTWPAAIEPQIANAIHLADRAVGRADTIAVRIARDWGINEQGQVRGWLAGVFLTGRWPQRPPAARRPPLRC